MYKVRKTAFVVVLWPAIASFAVANDFSVWKSWKALNTSWTSSNFSIECGDESYRIDKSIVGSLSVSKKDGDGNWEKIDGAQFSDTLVRFPSNYHIDGQFFQNDVMRLKVVQSIADDLRSASSRQSEQNAKKLEAVRASERQTADIALAKCEDEARKKYRPYYEKQKDLLKDDPYSEDSVNQQFEIRVRGTCMKFIGRISELEAYHVASGSSTPEPLYDVAVDSTNRETSTTLDFQSGARDLHIVGWPSYRVKITVGNFTKEQDGVLSPFDDIHVDERVCILFK